MAESKRVRVDSGLSEIPSRSITKQLSDGEGVVTHKNDEHVREVEKLRVQIQSMEEEIRRLYQSRYQLDQATKQNEKLVATLQEAKVADRSVACRS